MAGQGRGVQDDFQPLLLPHIPGIQDHNLVLKPQLLSQGIPAFPGLDVLQVGPVGQEMDAFRWRPFIQYSGRHGPGDGGHRLGPGEEEAFQALQAGEKERLPDDGQFPGRIQLQILNMKDKRNLLAPGQKRRDQP